MLKRRIIPIELYSSGRLVKTKQFLLPRDVGHPVKSSQVYSDQNADELVLLNIEGHRTIDKKFSGIISQISKSSFIPLTVGGGIRTLGDANLCFESGADKIILTSAVYTTPDLIECLAKKFGTQAVVIGIDVRKLDSGDYGLFSECGTKLEQLSLEVHISNIVASGAGEIFIQSIDRDGTMTGYDLILLSRVVASSCVPVIIAGGAGHFFDMLKAFEIGADAVACGSLFNFGDNNPIRAKAFLKNHSIPLRSA